MQMLIKVGDSGNPKGYKDGDVVDAFSELRIGYTHVEMLFKQHGLTRTFAHETHQYMFTKYGDGVSRLDLVNLTEDYLTDQPNDKGEYIHVQEYITRNPKKIYTVLGKQLWYGKPLTPTEERLDTLWEILAATAGKMRENYADWPVTDLEKCHFLPVSCCGTGHLSNGTVCTKKGSVIDRTGDEPVLVARRKWFVPYWDLGYDVDKVRNMEQSYDCRLPHDDSPLLDDTVMDKGL